ncbi:MAG: DUF4268 domain-containing protein [Maribacter sp.]|nr:DUF4268 domain-containing protein [Maribacter sp.]
MFSKEESKILRHDFWLSFGKSYPQKWILYNTRIKGLTLKFHFGLKKAMVSLDIEHSDLARRIVLWDNLNSLQSILKEKYISNALFADSIVLDNHKEISRIYVEKHQVCIHNKNTWQETMFFLNANMKQLEEFFLEYRDVINT